MDCPDKCEFNIILLVWWSTGNLRISEDNFVLLGQNMRGTKIF